MLYHRPGRVYGGKHEKIIEAMNKTEAAVSGMKIRRRWWEYVKEADDEVTLSGPAKF